MNDTTVSRGQLFTEALMALKDKDRAFVGKSTSDAQADHATADDDDIPALVYVLQPVTRAMSSASIFPFRWKCCMARMGSPPS